MAWSCSRYSGMLIITYCLRPVQLLQPPTFTTTWYYLVRKYRRKLANRRNFFFFFFFSGFPKFFNIFFFFQRFPRVLKLFRFNVRSAYQSIANSDFSSGSLRGFLPAFLVRSFSFFFSLCYTTFLLFHLEYSFLFYVYFLRSYCYYFFFRQERQCRQTSSVKAATGGLSDNS